MAIRQGAAPDTPDHVTSDIDLRKRTTGHESRQVHRGLISFLSPPPKLQFPTTLSVIVFRRRSAIHRFPTNSRPNNRTRPRLVSVNQRQHLPLLPDARISTVATPFRPPVSRATKRAALRSAPRALTHRKKIRSVSDELIHLLTNPMVIKVKIARGFWRKCQHFAVHLDAVPSDCASGE